MIEYMALFLVVRERGFLKINDARRQTKRILRFFIIAIVGAGVWIVAGLIMLVRYLMYGHA